MLTVFLERPLLMKKTLCYERTREAHYLSKNSSKLLDTPNVAGTRRGRRRSLRLRLATDSSIQAITSLPHTNLLIYGPNSRLTIARKLVSNAIQIFTGYLSNSFSARRHIKHIRASPELACCEVAANLQEM
jgi:hypothetical protein